MKKIMFVDDDLIFLEFIKNSILLTENFDIVVCSDTEYAFYEAKTQKPDIIFLDLKMPKDGGFGLLSKLRGDPDTKNIHIIILSGVSSFEARFKSMQMYCEGFLEKPCSDFDIRTKIAELGDNIEEIEKKL